MRWISYPIKTSPADLPAHLTDEQLLELGFVIGWRATRVEDAVAAEHLAEQRRHAHPSTGAEIAAETSREAEAVAAGDAEHAGRVAAVQGRADVAKRHV